MKNRSNRLLYFTLVQLQRGHRIELCFIHKTLYSTAHAAIVYTHDTVSFPHAFSDKQEIETLQKTKTDEREIIEAL